MRLLHVLWYDILERYFGMIQGPSPWMILRYFGTKIDNDFQLRKKKLFSTNKKFVYLIYFKVILVEIGML